MTGTGPLQAIIAANRAGQKRGIASWCTAHPDTLRAILQAHRGGRGAILIEATCNQVNHQGGYTGMTPLAFRSFVEGLASEIGVEASRIMLGGDHLGPNPWRHLPAAQAMAEARAMVAAYVAAGFNKIHLDASMACADDGRLSEEVMADRAAELCGVAEAAAGGPLTYVIGTEVPTPGGETAVIDTLAVTRPEAALRTYELHRAAFERRGLADALQRVIGIVVQPGVDFGNAQVFPYALHLAAELSAAISAVPAAVFEAHSTDYQSPQALADLVASHFAILKVGPELTFAFREAVFAMAAIEDYVPGEKSAVIAVIGEVMDADDRNWRAYIPAGAQQRSLKLFGLSDRVRYYWPQPRIMAALDVLRSNIDRAVVAPGLLAQYAGPDISGDAVQPLSTRIIEAKVGAVVKKYLAACGSA